MTLKKAIEILGIAVVDPDSVSALDLIDAQELGIEALKRVEDNRTAILPRNYSLLLGETKE